MDLGTHTLSLAFGLGLLGFVEPCTIGAHLLVLDNLRKVGPGARVGALASFILARMAIMGGFGGVIVLLGQLLIEVQTGFWLVFGLIFTGIGAILLAGGRLRLAGFQKLHEPRRLLQKRPWLMGIGFGMNIPACAAPILFGLLASATTVQSSVAGFALMGTFAIGLSLPLLPLLLMPTLARQLDRFAGWLRTRRWLLGLAFLLVGLWSVWFGLFVDPADWSGQ